MVFDLHSHVIPGVDDGAKDLNESIELVSALKQQGVQAIMATPHFYAEHVSLEDYIKKINSAFNTLKEALPEKMPELFLGYEVRYIGGLSEKESISSLTLGNSNYIMVELPYSDINRYMIDDIITMGINFNKIPVLAHIDRYIKFRNFDYLYDALENKELTAQLNADSVISGPSRKESLKLIKGGYITFVGSDTHSVNERPPRLDKFYDIVETKLGSEYLDIVFKNSKKLYNELLKK